MTPKQMARLGVFQIQEAVLSVLEQEPEGLEPERISTTLGVPIAIVQGVLAKLQREGYVEPAVEGRWKIISSDDSHISSNDSHIWTAEKFKELISGEKYEETYNSKGQIKRLSELGADLMNLVEKKQWQLSYRFRKNYFAFYFRDSRIFGFSLNECSPRLRIWLPENIVIDRENDGETNIMHERYYDWSGFAAYPTSVEVADIEGMLVFAYAWWGGE